jgi:hypothetical protein
LIGCVWGNGEHESGLVALQSLLTVKNGTIPFNFQSNEPFSKLLRQLLRYKVPWSKQKKIHCAHIALYLGRTIALPLINKGYKNKNFCSN